MLRVEFVCVYGELLRGVIGIDDTTVQARDHDRLVFLACVATGP